MQCLGRWWHGVPREQWPGGQEAAILEDFEGPDGDRRQELVFIGMGLGSKADTAARDAIYAALDGCLLTDAEMD
ncbi:unnamed protein product, partial [Phaeothamnion confervicola]